MVILLIGLRILLLKLYDKREVIQKDAAVEHLVSIVFFINFLVCAIPPQPHAIHSTSQDSPAMTPALPPQPTTHTRTITGLH